jgi:hypothetical protein
MAVLDKVPEGKVGEEVQKFIDYDGKTDIHCTANGDGTWKIDANKPLSRGTQKKKKKGR